MNVRADRRAAIERDHARVVDHLIADDDSIGSLDDARAVAINGRHEGANRAARDAPVIEREVLDLLPWTDAERSLQAWPFLRGGGERRDAAVRWLDHHRGVTEVA